MKDNFTQQEILLMTETGFASRQYSEKDNTGHLKNLSADEKLREACWNGLLKDILPELFFAGWSDPKLFLWQMREAQHLLALQMAEQPVDIDEYYSIDPYCFLKEQGFS